MGEAKLFKTAGTTNHTASPSADSFPRRSSNCRRLLKTTNPPPPPNLLFSPPPLSSSTLFFLFRLAPFVAVLFFFFEVLVLAAFLLGGRRRREGRGLMKFGKEFRIYLEETLPEWRDKYLCYKPLKKFVKSIPSPPIPPPPPPPPPAAAAAPLPDPAAAGEDADERWGHLPAAPDAAALAAAVEEWFVGFLNDELDKFNDFYVDKEEDFVIRLQRVWREKTIVNMNGEAWRKKKKKNGVGLPPWGFHTAEGDDKKSAVKALF
ncbi:hypothetical protein Taro_018184 [Colocasia esculenta]|uniref:SPX domain-containing protein n=1 Tax=Colocasia esculenta TaxID=4460 RepID=A0A843UYA5_COLES|nr:hypothetical protein [Colocasia esculenta]